MSKLSKILFAITFLIIGIASYTFYESSNSNKELIEANNIELLGKIGDSNIARSGEDNDLRYELRQSKVNLLQEISKLKSKVDSLEAKLKELDQITYKVELESSKPSVKWMDLSNWRKLQKGLKEEEVIRLLGTPTQRMANTQRSVTLRYYGYGKSGSVVIDSYLGVSTWGEPTN
jgi:predicted nuclease with TOPRIM domain